MHFLYNHLQNCILMSKIITLHFHYLKSFISLIYLKHLVCQKNVCNCQKIFCIFTLQKLSFGLFTVFKTFHKNHDIVMLTIPFVNQLSNYIISLS